MTRWRWHLGLEALAAQNDDTAGNPIEVLLVRYDAKLISIACHSQGSALYT